MHIGFILLPQFVLGSFAAFADLLGQLDSQSDTPGPCTWEVLADTLIPVRSVGAIQVVPTSLLGDPLRFDTIVIVGGTSMPPPTVSSAKLAWLRQAARAGRHLAGLNSGVFVLAQAGVLAGHRVCVAGEHYQEFMRRYPAFAPGQIITDRQYIIDRRCITCAGGPAAIEIASYILQHHLPAAEVRRALHNLQIGSATQGGQSQTQPPPPDIPPHTPAAVRRAVLLMKQYAGQNLSMVALTTRLGLSPRQLQRLFREHLDTTPQAYARLIRLRQVRWMLEHSSKSLATIASDCGFADAAHMGRAFRQAHGQAPGAWRRQARQAKNTV